MSKNAPSRYWWALASFRRSPGNFASLETCGTSFDYFILSGAKTQTNFCFRAPTVIENHQGKDSRCSTTFSIVSRDFFFEGIFPGCQGAHDAVFIACEHFVFDFMEVIVETLPEQPLPPFTKQERYAQRACRDRLLPNANC